MIRIKENKSTTSQFQPNIQSVSFYAAQYDAKKRHTKSKSDLPLHFTVIQILLFLDSSLPDLLCCVL